MIDCHSHLIPKLDDGSTSLEASVNQLKQMAAGGVSAVFLTSHYMRGKYQFSKEHYDALFKELVAEVKHQSIPITLYPGAEVFLIKGITEDIKQKNLTLADSNYVLVETDLNGFPLDFYANLFELLHKGYHPIIAHAERYVSVMSKPSEIEEYIEKNIYMQVNSGSLIGGYGEKVKSTAWKIVEKGWAHLVASDAHLTCDYESYFLARDKIIEHIDEYTAELLFQKYPQKILNKEKIPYKYVSVKHSHRRSKSMFRSLFG